jgi:hypothetical protein
MKRIGTAALAAVLALGTLSTAARANQGIYGIWWDAQDTSSNGLGFGFRSKVQVNTLVSFDTRVSWIKFSDDDVNVFPIEATGMLKLGMVYAGAGIGYYIFDVNDDQEDPLAPGNSTRINDVDNNFGWYAVAGIDIPAGPVGIFGEVKWMALSSDASVGGKPATLDADGVGFHAGVMFGAKP